MMFIAAFLIRPKLRKTGKFKSLFLIGQQVFGAALTAVEILPAVHCPVFKCKKYISDE